MMKHSPEPWRVEIDDGQYLIKSGKNHLIAIIEGMVGEYENDEYDAYLMASSPLLLGVARDCLGYFKGEWAAVGNHPSARVVHYIKFLEVAIALAAPPDEARSE